MRQIGFTLTALSPDYARYEGDGHHPGATYACNELVRCLNDASPELCSRTRRRGWSGGLVERKPDPHDRRAALLHVTWAGRAALLRLNMARAAMFEEILTEWPEQERYQAVKLLTCLAGQLDGWMLDRSSSPRDEPVGNRCRSCGVRFSQIRIDLDGLRSAAGPGQLRARRSCRVRGRSCSVKDSWALDADYQNVYLTCHFVDPSLERYGVSHLTCGALGALLEGAKGVHAVKAGICSFRLGGRDGVSAAVEGFAAALPLLDIDTVTIAGEGTADRIGSALSASWRAASVGRAWK